MELTLALLLYGLFIVSVLPSLLSGDMPFALWAVYPLVIVSSAWLKKPLARPGVRRTVNVVTIAAFFAFAANAVSNGDYLLNAVFFVLAMAIVKLYQRDTNWDRYQLVALTFLSLLGGAILNPSLGFGLAFLVYVVLLAWTLMFLHFRRFDPALKRVSRDVLPPRFFVLTSLLAVVLFLSSFLLFFLFPRMGLGFFVAQVRNAQKVAGFGERVDLGGFGTIRDNETVVMRARPQDGDPFQGPLRLRGHSLDRYDGRSWSRTKLERIEISRDGEGHYPLGSFNGLAAQPAEDCSDSQLTLYIEPLEIQAKLLFAPPFLTQVRPPASRLDFLRKARLRVFQDAAGDAYYQAKDTIGLQYEAWTRTCVRRAPPPLNERERAWLRTTYTQLPEDRDPRIRELAERLSADLRLQERGARVIAQALESHLRARYEYTLDEAHPEEQPLSHFLFESPRGHCEYFASAMVVMLRTLGIPARIVNGFYGGRWNPLGGYIQVRQGDAHSWVEAWDDDQGWVTWDPTPPGQLAAASQASWVAGVNEWIDYLRYRWLLWVVEYNLEKQFEVLKKVSSAFDIQPGVKGLKAFAASVKRGVLALLAGLAGLGLIALLYRAWLRFRGRSRRRGGRQRAALSLFEDWRRICQRAGHPWLDDDTVLTHATRVVEAASEARGDVTWLLQLFHDALYGGHEVEPPRLDEGRQRLRAVRKVLSRR